MTGRKLNFSKDNMRKRLGRERSEPFVGSSVLRQTRFTERTGSQVNEERAGRGRFAPAVLRDAQGRRLVPADPREVERRLKARLTERNSDGSDL